jgi:hypothetical protein
MPTLRFTGRVLPAALNINVKNLPTVHYYEAPQKLTMNYTMSIFDSEVNVQCEASDFDEANLHAFFLRAYDFVRVATDIICFTRGLGLTVYLDKVYKPDGSWNWMLPEQKPLSALVTAINPSENDASDSNFDSTFRRVIQEPGLFMALNDLVGAITLPHHAPVNCARAIEGLRTLLVPKGGDRKQAWPIFRSALNVEQAYIEFITDLSTAPRHGDRTHIPGIEVEETTKRSWILMNRFLEYRRRSNQPLPLSEFSATDLDSHA